MCRLTGAVTAAKEESSFYILKLSTAWEMARYETMVDI